MEPYLRLVRPGDPEQPSANPPVKEQRPVPHDPHAATTGSGIARTIADVVAGIQTMTTLSRGAWIDSRIHAHHTANVRLARLSWTQPIHPWRQSDAVRVSLSPVRVIRGD